MSSTYYVNSTGSGAGCVIKYITGLVPGNTVSYVIGAAGINTTSPTNGGTSIFGGTTTSSCYCYANGGAANLTPLNTSSFIGGIGVDGTL